MEDRYLNLLAEAKAAGANSYSPYSRYPVGAAILWETGRITTGCNVENSSYGLTVCAERNAIYKGICEGERKISALAVSVQDSKMPSPCGACRQVIREFAEECPIILQNGEGKIAISSLRELLPNSFGPEFLEKNERR
ncbi:cytidine deaminase [Syntrophobotulus glycolicus DSM 8271]|uniref:Cytidine deaminase n=1 Tax=Syntrophobotulus glycolicus (strain DSM 8271 / FlGlyR) TaxID=645991 RepID=F0SVD4_SYNGF|nr:cytidine deaminase [Syntrophobotulus glycolicus]ADY56707.1 cytidine deaminase [Syntrophobotulus glycolicus DSM 8271]